MRASRLTTKEFIQRAKEKHGSKYDYSVSEYTRSNAYVEIRCKTHGKFKQRASSHLAGKGCIKCSRNMLPNTEAFLLKVKHIHGKKYDTSKVQYKNQSSNVILGCKVHGDFTVRANLLLSGRGCQKCSLSLNQKDFLERARQVHGEFYSYDKVNYLHINREVTITCPKHEDFAQQPNNHFKGHGCPVCGHRKNNNFAKVEVSLGKRKVQVQGYEPYALSHLVDVEGIPPSAIKVGDEVPVIRYYDSRKGKERRHYPDIYIPSKNTLVEVKSPYLFLKGLRSLRLKRKGAKEAGYKYRVCVIDKRTKEKISLPKGWYKMKASLLKKVFV